MSVAVFGEKALALVGLEKGAEIYIEGRLSLSSWTGRDGEKRTWLSVAAWEMMPLARIGRNRPKKPRPEHAGGLRFDDDLSF